MKYTKALPFFCFIVYYMDEVFLISDVTNTANLSFLKILHYVC